MTQVIGILNPKGGSGKTTLTINLARAFQQLGYRVLIVDSDPQGTARDWSLAGQENYPETEQTVVVGVDRPVLEKEIPQISHAFDIILIDGAAKLQEMTASSLKVVDAILIPVQTSLADIWSALDLVDIIKARQQVTDGRPLAAFLVSRQTQNSRLAGDIDQALKQHELTTFKSRTTNRVVYMETLSAGTTVIDQEPNGAAAQEIKEIRDELIGFLGLRR